MVPKSVSSRSWRFHHHLPGVLAGLCLSAGFNGRGHDTDMGNLFSSSVCSISLWINEGLIRLPSILDWDLTEEAFQKRKIQLNSMPRRHNWKVEAFLSHPLFSRMKSNYTRAKNEDYWCTVNTSNLTFVDSPDNHTWSKISAVVTLLRGSHVRVLRIMCWHSGEKRAQNKYNTFIACNF